MSREEVNAKTPTFLAVHQTLADPESGGISVIHAVDPRYTAQYYRAAFPQPQRFDLYILGALKSIE